MSQQIYQKISEIKGWFTPADIAKPLGIREADVLSRLTLMRRQAIIEHDAGRWRAEVDTPPDPESTLSLLMGDHRYTDFIPRRLLNGPRVLQRT